MHGTKLVLSIATAHWPGDADAVHVGRPPMSQSVPGAHPDDRSDAAMSKPSMVTDEKPEAVS